MIDHFYKLRPNLSSSRFYLLCSMSIPSTYTIRLIPLLTVVHTIEKSRREIKNIFSHLDKYLTFKVLGFGPTSKLPQNKIMKGLVSRSRAKDWRSV